MKAAFLGLLCLAGLPAVLQARAIRASQDPVKDEPPVTEKDRSHWAFTPLRRPEPPVVKNPAAAPSEVDRFILAALEAAGLSLSPEADAASLIRRVTLDLTGLPPRPEVLQKVVAAHEQERRAQGGASASATRAYEAYVDGLLASPQYGEAMAQPWLDLARFAETDGFEHDIERKHAWKYRDWVIQALNRDLPLDEFVRQQIAGDLLPGGEVAATGFLLSGPDMPDINNQDERRHFVLNDMTATFGSAFLGLTLGCAACHDHAFDPVSQADFYRLRAFFDPMPEFKRDRQLGPEMRAPEAGAAPVSHVYVRGDFTRAGPVVRPGFPRIAGSGGMPAGSRADLARWLTRADNALFVRVAANRLWQQHFGRGLAPDPNDFGLQGGAPTHPALLDWLASELPRQEWSLKRTHKLVVMSATYRQSSLGVAGGGGDAHYAAYPRKRLSAEALRDSMLAAAGLLNPKAGGPGVRVPLPPEVARTLLKSHQQVTQDPAEHRRRSVYLFARRNLRLPLFDLFDRPDALMSCGRRNESTTAPQALLLFNSAFSQEVAAELARQLLEGGETAAGELATQAAWRVLCRAPSAEELRLGSAFLTAHTARTPSLREALADYCLALLNSNAFVWVD